MAWMALQHDYFDALISGHFPCSNLCVNSKDQPVGDERKYHPDMTRLLARIEEHQGAIESAAEGHAASQDVKDICQDLKQMGLHGSRVWCDECLRVNINPFSLRLPDILHTLELGQLGRSHFDALVRSVVVSESLLLLRTC